MKKLAVGVSSRARRPQESVLAFCERFLALGMGSVLVEGPVAPASGDFAGVAAELAAFAEATRGSGARLAGVRAAAEAGEPRSLVSRDAAVRRRTLEEHLVLGRRAVALGCRVVLVSAGREVGSTLSLSGADPGAAGQGEVAPLLRSTDSELEHLCAGLHGLSRALPDVAWCLTPGEALDELPRPQDFALVRSDLGRRAPSFWHDTGIAALRSHRDGIAQGAWLDDAGGHLAGLTLSDSDGQRTGLPPGSGIADLSGLSDALTLDTPVVLGLSAEFGEAAFRHALGVATRLPGGASGSPHQG